MTSFEGASVPVTGGSRGSEGDRAVVRPSLGASASRSACEATLRPRRPPRGHTLGAELILGGGTSPPAASPRRSLRSPRRARARRRDRRPARGARDRRQALGLTLSANARALPSLTRAAAPSMPSGSSIVGVSSLGSVRARQLHARGRFEGRPRSARALSRSRAVPPRHPRERCLGRRGRDRVLESTSNKEAMSTCGECNPVGRLVSPDDVLTRHVLCSPDADMIRAGRRSSSTEAGPC